MWPEKGKQETVNVSQRERERERESGSLQTSLEKNILNFSYTVSFSLRVNFENLIVRLHICIISFLLAKFQENQRLIAMSSNKY